MAGVIWWTVQDSRAYGGDLHVAGAFWWTITGGRSLFLLQGAIVFCGHFQVAKAFWWAHIGDSSFFVDTLLTKGRSFFVDM